VLTELFVQGTAPAEECFAFSPETEGEYPSSADDAETSSYPSDEAIGTSEQPSAEERESQNRNSRRQTFTAESRDLETQPDSDIAAHANQPLERRSSNEAEIRDNESEELDEEKWYSRGAEMNPVEKQERRPTRSYKNDAEGDSHDIDYADDYATDYEDDRISD
jgi:hypothetical protein